MKLLLLLIASLMASGNALAQNSCNPNATMTIKSPAGPFFMDETLRVSANIGAGAIQGGSYLDIPGFGFALNCLAGQNFQNCIAAGNTVEFLGNMTTTCKDSAGDPVNLIIPQANVIPMQPDSFLPIRTPANTMCNVQFDIAIRELAESNSNRKIHQALGWPIELQGELAPATCNNDLTANGSASMAYTVHECGIELEKEVSTNGGGTWSPADSSVGAPQLLLGGTAQYRLVIRNTGTVAYTSPISVVDAALGINTTIPALAAGESTTVTSGQIPALLATGRCQVVGALENESSVEGICRGGANEVSATASDSAWIECVGAPGVSIEKSTNGQDADTPTGPQIPVGGSVTWNYLVTNTGTLPLTNIAVTDSDLGAITCPGTSLAVGANMTCTANGNAVAGQYSNVGTVTADSAGGSVNDSDPSHYFGVAGGITIEKSTNGQDADTPTGPYIPVGASVNWTYQVTNTSNTTLTNVTVVDNQGVSVTCPKTTLTAGESMTCTGSGSAEAGQYANIGTATGTPPVGAPVQDTDPSHYFGSAPSINIDKTANPTTYTGAGESITYTFVVTNNGNVTLTNVTVDDPLPGLGTITCDWAGSTNAGTPAFTLAVGESVTCTAPYTTTQDDVNAGQVDNTATATGTPPVGPDVEDSDPATISSDALPSIAVTKEISIDDGQTWLDANNEGTAAVAVFPSAALYRITVKNDGSVALQNVVVNDVQLGITNYAVGNLAVGQEVVLTAGTLTKLNVEVACSGRGTFSNTATAAGQSQADGTPVNDTDTAVLVCIGEASIAILKEISPTGPDGPWYDDETPPQEPPSNAWYRITITNNGTSPLEEIVLQDGDLTPPLLVSDFSAFEPLAPGSTIVLTSAELDELFQDDRCTGAGSVGNIASVTAASVDDPDDTVSDSDSATLVCVGAPDIEVVKEISLDNSSWVDANTVGQALVTQAPASVYYRITVRNIGPVDLVNVVLNDGTLGIMNHEVGTIAAGAQVVLTNVQLPALYYPSRCINAGEFGNTATAQGQSADTGASSSDSDEAWLECTGTPAIQIIKEISVAGVNGPWFDDTSPTVSPPADAWYRLTVSNTGTADLENVVVNDPTLGIANYAIGDLLIGETEVLGQAQIPALYKQSRCTAGGLFVNTASTSGTSVDFPFGSVNDSDTATLSCEELTPICANGQPPNRLKFRYDADDDSDNDQTSDVITPTTVNFPAVVDIKTYDARGNKETLLQTYTNVTVNTSGMYVESSPKIPPTIRIKIFQAGTSTVLQSIQFHGSCSEPLSAGDEFGGITITGGVYF